MDIKIDVESDFKMRAVIAAYPVAAAECRGKSDEEVADRALEMARSLADKIDFTEAGDSAEPTHTRAKKQALSGKRGRK